MTVIYELVSCTGKDYVSPAYLFSTVFNNLQSGYSVTFIGFETVLLTYESKHNVLCHISQQLSHRMLIKIK